MSNRTNYNRFVKNYSNLYNYPDNYNKSSTAPAYSPTHGASTKRKKNKKMKRKPRKKMVFKYKEDNIRGVSSLAGVTIGIIFLGLICISIAFAMNREAQLKIISLNEELQKIQQDNNLIKTEISERYDITVIENIATTKLGMSKPKPYQIVHINVPAQSSVIQYKQSNTSADSEIGVLGKISKLLSNLQNSIKL